MRTIRSTMTIAAALLTGVLLVQGTTAASASTKPVEATSAAAAVGEDDCSARIQEKPLGAPVLRMAQGSALIELPADSSGCTRIVRIVGDDDRVAADVPAGRAVSSVAVPVPDGVYRARFKIVDESGESSWSSDSGPGSTGMRSKRAGDAAVSNLRASLAGGGLSLRWRAGVRGEAVGYAVRVSQGQRLVLSASLARSVDRLWLAMSPGEYRIGVLALDDAGRVVGTATATAGAGISRR